MTELPQCALVPKNKIFIQGGEGMFITSIFKDLKLLFDYIVVTIVLNKTLISLRFSKA